MALSCLLLKKAATQIGTYHVDSSACFTGLPQIPKQLTNPIQARILTARIAQVDHKKPLAVSPAADHVASSTFLFPAPSQTTQYSADSWGFHQSTGRKSVLVPTDNFHTAVLSQLLHGCQRWGRKPAHSSCHQMSKHAAQTY